MSVHEQFAEDLALYALGSLDGDERATLEKHLDTCSSCRQELESLARRPFALRVVDFWSASSATRSSALDVGDRT